MRLKPGPSAALVILAASAVFYASAFGGDAEIGIPKAVPYAQGVQVSDAVKNECQLGEKVSEFLLHDANVKVSDKPNEGRYLDMSITEVFASAGGAWSGPKWMTVTGTLMENGKKVASFRAKRFSTGGAFGGFKGTCSIVGRCTKTIAEDIAGWLKNPVDGAQLGDAKSG